MTIGTSNFTFFDFIDNSFECISTFCNVTYIHYFIVDMIEL